MEVWIFVPSCLNPFQPRGYLKLLPSAFLSVFLFLLHCHSFLPAFRWSYIHSLGLQLRQDPPPIFTT